MTIQKRRTIGPILDSRTIENPNAPKHNYLNSPRGASLEQPDTVVEDTGPEVDIPRVGRSQTVPLRQSLLNAQDYSRRESSRPLGDVYEDIDKMIKKSVTTSQFVPGTGLVESDNVLSVDSSLIHVNEIGTLSSLSVSGSATFAGTVSVPAPTAGTHAVTRDYADGLAITAGTGLTKTGSMLSLDTSAITSVGTLTALDVSGNATFAGAVNVPAPTAGTHAVTRDYADSLTVTAGTGLTKTGNSLAINPTAITSVGTLTGLAVTGDATFTGGTVVVPTPTAGDQAATRDYADSLTVTAGTGLTKTGNTLAIDPPAITSVGTLTGLAVTGALVTPLQYFAPADGDTVTAADTSSGIIVNPGTTIGALTIVFPGTPVNGQRFSIHPTQDVTALTATATFAPNNAPPAGLTAGTPLRYIYSGDIGGWIVF